jgi:hypothetical protein
MPFEPFHEFRQRLGAATKRRHLERELNDEVSFHPAMREQKHRSAWRYATTNPLASRPGQA